MKFAVTVLSAVVVSIVNAQVHQDNAIYYHQQNILGASIWHFSADGLIVFSPDGQVLKQPLKSTVCQEYTTTDSETNATETIDTCRFFELRSDGHRYVWAGSRAAVDQVEAFDIDTADHVGSVETCPVPMDLDYHPGRQEMFVHCHSGEVDVFSSNTFGSDFSIIDLGVGGFPSGRLVSHPSLGATAYSATSANPFLVEVNLANRTAVARHALPLADGARNMAYSAVNQHIFVRPRVCCTCGAPDLDAASCGGFRAPTEPEPVTITTGPSVGTNVLGVCGTACEGSKADTIGVYEFDTVSKTIVGSHNIDAAIGYGAMPVASPDGKYILLIGNDGGKAVPVIRPGANGAASTQVGTIETGFTGLPGTSVVEDFAFVQDDTRNLVVLASTTDNEIVIADMRDFSVQKLALSPAADSTAGSDRYVEWAVGTNYVWLSGGDANELYIVELPSKNIQDAQLHKTIPNIAAGEILFVDNFERKAAAAQLSADWISQSSLSSRGNSGDVLVMAALLIGVVSLFLSAAALFKVLSTVPLSASDAVTVAKQGNASVAYGGADARTLGSKHVA